MYLCFQGPQSEPLPWSVPSERAPPLLPVTAAFSSWSCSSVFWCSRSPTRRCNSVACVLAAMRAASSSPSNAVCVQSLAIFNCLQGQAHLWESSAGMVLGLRQKGLWHILSSFDNIRNILIMSSLPHLPFHSAMWHKTAITTQCAFALTLW